MTKVIIEIDCQNNQEQEFLSFLEENQMGTIVRPQKLSGTTEIVIASIQLTSSIIGLIAAFYAYKKEKGKKTLTIDKKKIIVEGLTEEEIKNILKKKLK